MQRIPSATHGKPDPIPDPAIEIRDLRLLLALAQAGTTKAAGQLLHLAQPSVSRALLSLEERLGQELCHRTPRGLAATPACERLCGQATLMLTELSELERQVRAPAQRHTKIRVVAECHTAYHWMPATLSVLRERFPDAELELKVECSRDPLTALAAGEVDAALLTSALKPSRELEVEPLFEDELIFVVAASHPLARRKSLSVEDLRAHTLYTVKPTRQEAQRFVAAVYGRSAPSQNVSYIQLTEAVAGFARAGMGIGLLTEWVAKDYLQDGALVAKRLGKQRLTRSWRLAWQRDLGDAGSELLRALKQCEAQT